MQIQLNGLFYSALGWEEDMRCITNQYATSAEVKLYSP